MFGKHLKSSESGKIQLKYLGIPLFIFSIGTGFIVGKYGDRIKQYIQDNLNLKTKIEELSEDIGGPAESLVEKVSVGEETSITNLGIPEEWINGKTKWTDIGKVKKDASGRYKYNLKRLDDVVEAYLAAMINKDAELMKSLIIPFDRDDYALAELWGKDGTEEYWNRIIELREKMIKEKLSDEEIAEFYEITDKYAEDYLRSCLEGEPIRISNVNKYKIESIKIFLNTIEEASSVEEINMINVGGAPILADVIVSFSISNKEGENRDGVMEFHRGPNQWMLRFYFPYI